MTLKTGIMEQIHITGINNSLKYNIIENYFFLNVIPFHNINKCYHIFWSIKCSFGEWTQTFEDYCCIYLLFYVVVFSLFPLHLRCMELPFGVHFPSLAGCDGPHKHTHTHFLSCISAQMARQPLFEWEPTLQALFCGFFTFQPQCQIIVYVPLCAQSQFVLTNVAPHYGTLEICVSTAQAVISWKKYSETHSALDSSSAFYEL